VGRKKTRGKRVIDCGGDSWDKKRRTFFEEGSRDGGKGHTVCSGIDGVV
jgi:hypothetical protein